MAKVKMYSGAIAAGGRAENVCQVESGLNYLWGVFVRGAGLEGVRIEFSDGSPFVQVPCRDIALQTDALDIAWVPFGTGIHLETSTQLDLVWDDVTGTATIHAYFWFGANPNPTAEDKGTLIWRRYAFTSTDAEPVNIGSVPTNIKGGRTKFVPGKASFIFCRGADLENLSLEIGGTSRGYVVCRDIAVLTDVEPVIFSNSQNRYDIPVSPGGQIHLTEIDHGTGGAADIYFAYSA